MKIKVVSLIICVISALSISSCVVPDGRLVTHSSTSLSVLPTGYRTVNVGGDPYYYARNSWYRRHNGRYIGCSRPHGYRGSIGSSYARGYGNHYGLSRLPSGYSSVSYGGQIFYNNGSSWYNRNGGRYHRCSAPRGYRNNRYHSNRRTSYGSRNHTRHNDHRGHHQSSYSRNSSRTNHTNASNHRSNSASPSRSSVYRGNLRRAAGH